MGTPRLLTLLAALVLPVTAGGALSTTTSADAVRPADHRGADSWTKVTSGDVRNTAEPALYRTANGVLHIAYLRHHPTSVALAFTTVRPHGATGATGVAVNGWASLPEDPKLVGGPGGGMRLVFGGSDGVSASPYETGQMFSATSSAAGTTWALQPGALTDSHYAMDSYGTGATTMADGTPVVSFPLNGVLTWNAGAGDSTYDFGACCLYDSTLARSGDDVWVSFAANGSTSATAGLFVKQLLPTTGATMKVPRSSEGTDTLTPLQATAFVARPGGGLWTAYCIGYPTCDKVGLWRVGSGQPRSVPGSREARDIAITAAPNGRLWIAWTTYDEVRVAHTGATGTDFGAVRTLRAPRAGSGLYGIAIAGTNRSADVVVNTGSALYHQQVRLDAG